MTTESWTSLDSTPGRRIFFRPLGSSETTFYWAGVSSNTADTVMHIHLRTAQASDQVVHSQSNILRSWVSVKRRFPLIAAEVEEHEFGPRFIIREETVMNLRPDDVTFTEVDSFHHAECFVTDIMDGPRRLSSQLLTRAYILRRTDKSDHFHVVIMLAHCITDAAGTSTVLRTFFDTLSSQIEPPYIPLGERMHSFKALESNLGSRDLSLVKRRWRRALGYAIDLARMSRFKGGHTLPGDFRESTPHTSAKKRNHVSVFSRAVSSTILTNCRRHGITMNSAYYALSQVAMARVLCRRYLRGQISEEEWEYRKRQPMYVLGPVNLRPYQDKDWFETGGSGDVGVGIGTVQYVLPFMPLGDMSRGDPSRLELIDGAPDFPALMSFDRFLLRCANVKAQAQKLLEHPRLVDICTSTVRLHWTPFGREIASKWLKTRDSVQLEDGDKSISVQSLDPIYTQGGATLGNMDHVLPTEYPLPPEHYLSPLHSTPHAHRAGYAPWSPQAAAFEDAKTPRPHVEYWRAHAHITPAKLYLGASTARQQLQYFVSYDQHVFSEKIVTEWLSELKDATLWYLGQPHSNGTPLQSKL
ncbi:uncharacterized protein HD556DRAFT_1371530 [Suillus plorans]|uniref:Condensation domain-containing protein n=1 Tax=Suillus plorans TaxID=116603 RepID=A0A9P7DIF1_9AGAM|nr:uncharacterized protein HD556DRAFT_1371530 [Suillus plorans]KAG1794191.1 hypothetical protein HD556DRAFT_1371530 [Suillus plorans]